MADHGHGIMTQPAVTDKMSERDIYTDHDTGELTPESENELILNAPDIQKILPDSSNIPLCRSTRSKKPFTIYNANMGKYVEPWC